MMGLICMDLSITYSLIFFIKKYASENPFAATTCVEKDFFFKDVRYYILCLLKFYSLNLLFVFHIYFNFFMRYLH